MTKIINISKIVCIVQKYGHNNTIPKENVFSEVVKNQHPSEGRCRKSNYKKHISICKKLNLIQEENLNFVLTEMGIKYHKLVPTYDNKKEFSEKTDELKKIIVKIIDSKESLKNEFGEIHADVEIHDSEEKMYINKNEEQKIDKNFFELLEDIDLISSNNGKNKKISSKIYKKIKKYNKPKISIKELYDKFEKQKEIGEKAEIATMEYEKKRLRGLGTKEEIINQICRISIPDASAGYDIASFEKGGTEHDRFIEVKGTTSNTANFYWSENELDVSKKNGDKYFVYLWINVGKPNQELFSMIKNPFHEIIEKKYENMQEIKTFRVSWDKQTIY
jgi:hypothetical protein